MYGKKLAAMAAKGMVLILLLAFAWHAKAQDAKTPYPTMAPVDNI